MLHLASLLSRIYSTHGFAEKDRLIKRVKTYFEYINKHDVAHLKLPIAFQNMRLKQAELQRRDC